jgi:hypothetical protein
VGSVGYKLPRSYTSKYQEDDDKWGVHGILSGVQITNGTAVGGGTTVCAEQYCPIATGTSLGRRLLLAAFASEHLRLRWCPVWTASRQNWPGDL